MPPMAIAVLAVKAFHPPTVEDRKIEHAVHRCLHAAGAGGFERAARNVHPNIDAVHEITSDLLIVIFDKHGTRLPARAMIDAH